MSPDGEPAEMSRADDEDELRRRRDNVGYLAGQALQGILSGSLIVGSPGVRRLKTMDEIVELAAQYGEALAERIENLPAAEA